MKEYFFSKGEEQFGPFSLEQLADKNLLANTMVWSEGMDNWQKASTIPELKSIIIRHPPPPLKKNNQETVLTTASSIPKKKKNIISLLVFSIIGIIASLLSALMGIGVANLSAYPSGSTIDILYEISKFFYSFAKTK